MDTPILVTLELLYKNHKDPLYKVYYKNYGFLSTLLESELYQAREEGLVDFIDPIINTHIKESNMDTLKAYRYLKSPQDQDPLYEVYNEGEFLGHYLKSEIDNESHFQMFDVEFVE